MNKNSNKKTFIMPPNIKILAVPLVSLFGIIICFIVAFKIGLGKIADQNKKIKTIGKNIIVLEKKQSTLAQVKATLQDDIQFFSLALPDSNPSLSIIYQIRNFSAKNALLFQNIKSGSEGKEKDYSNVDLNFDLSGDLYGIFSFVKTTESFAPIVSVEKIKITQSGGVYMGSVTLRGYWADFPKKIPAIAQPISDFSDEEVEVILKISQLSIPPFSNLFPTTSPERINPFE